MVRRIRTHLVSFWVTIAIVASLLLFPSSALGDIVPLVESGKTSYLLGEQVSLSGAIGFEAGEMFPLDSVTLSIDGPQSVEQALPTSPGQYTFSDTGVTVNVAWNNVAYGYGYGYSFKGLSGSAAIEWDISWAAPIFLRPAPTFTLIPGLTEAFPISSPTPVVTDDGGDLPTLPDTEQQFPIPLVGTPEPGQPSALPTVALAFPVPLITVAGEEGAPADLPTLTEAFPIPLAPTPEPEEGAPADLPTLTEAFPVPVFPTPEPEEGAPAPLPTVTEAFPVPQAATPTPEAGAVDSLPTMGTVFTIPTAPTPTPISGVAELPSRTELFDIPGGRVPQGLTYDGTYFYILVDGSPADQILKVDGNGAQQAIWDVKLAGENRNNAEGIAYLDNTLYVSDTNWYWDPSTESSGYPIMKFKTSDGSFDSYFFAPDWQRFSGLHADGARLWAIRNDGGQLYKMSKLGVVVSSPYLEWPYTAAGAVAAGSGDYDYIYTVEGESIVKRNKSDGSKTGSSWSITDSLIRGLTYSGGVLYFVDADTSKLYKAQAPHGIVPTTNPLGMAYDGQYLYILVDAAPKDKILVVDPTDANDPPAIVRSFDAPNSKADALEYFDGFLWVGQVDGCCDRQIKKLDAQAGNVIATLDLDNPIWNDIKGLANNGTQLIGFTNNDRGFFTISKTDGAATLVEGAAADQWGYSAGAYRISTNRAYSAKDNKVYEFNSAGDQLQTMTLATGTIVKGLTFIGPNLYIADDSADTIYRGSIPHGITISKDPLALAYGQVDSANTLFILVDGTPKDKILLVNPTDGSLTGSYNAPDSKGEGLTYVGTSLYYASNEGEKRIYELNPADGTEIANFRPKSQWNYDIGDNLLGLGSDGTDLILSTNNQWDPCFEKVDTGTGDNEGRLCADYETGIKQAKGVAVASDGFILAAKSDDLYQLNPEGKEHAKWQNLTGVSDIEGLAFAGATLYIADDGSNKIFKTTVPSGINVTTDPLALAYGTANEADTLFVLVDGTPKDKILLVNPTDGTLAGSYDAPGKDGEGLTYLGTSLYYTSNKDNNRRIYELNPNNGTEIADFQPQDAWGNYIWEALLGLGNDGTNLILATNNAYDPCVQKIDKSNGENEGRLCADYETGIKQAKGVAVASDGFILAAKSDDLYQLNPEGKEHVKWQNLTGVSDIEGLAFVGATLYIADDGSNKIYKTTVPTGISVTADPRALAYGVANEADTLFVLVNATPRDKILLVNPTDGSLMDSYNAPDDKGQGLTYLGTFLYYTSNKDNNRRIYELNPDTGAQIANFQPQDNWGNYIWNELLGLGNDGTNLILSSKQGDPCLDEIDASNGDNEGRLCADWDKGIKQADGVAVHPDGSMLVAKDAELAQLHSDGQQLKKWKNLRTGNADIMGLAFIGSTLYIADDNTNKVYKTSIPSGITTDPLGLAYGVANDVDTLFILVDAAPKDKILLVNPTDGALVASYDGPTKDGAGLTYMGTSLYYAGRDQEGRARIFELDPADGATLSSITPKWGGGWEIWDEPRSLANDGSDLLLYFGDDNCVQKIDPGDGDNNGSLCPWEWDDGLMGARGMTVASDSSIFSARDREVVQIVVSGQGSFTEVGRWATNPTLDVEGLAFVGEVLYLADDSGNKIYKASKPSGITASPQGLAYDGTYLYILVDGGLKDHIVVVDPDTGMVDRDFAAPSRESLAITYLGTSLYVTSSEDTQSGWVRTIRKISPTDGAVLSTLSVPGDFYERLTGLANDGSRLVGTQDQGMFAVFMNNTGGFMERVDFYDDYYIDGFDSLAFHDPSDDLFATQGMNVFRFDDDGRKLSDFTTSLDAINGAVFVGGILYLAEAGSNTIQAAAIPTPSTTVTTTPGGMATDGASLYLVVDGTPKDKILVMSTNPGAILNSYNAPGDNVNALAWHNGYLYAVTNEFHPDRGQQPPRVFKLNPGTGGVLQEFEIQSPWGGVLGGSVYGLASDGAYLYAGVKEDGGGWFRFDPANPSAVSVRTNVSVSGRFRFMESPRSLEVAEAQPGQPRLLAGGYADGVPVVSRFDKETGVMLDQWELDGVDVRGMAYIGTTLYLADAATGRILTTTLPDNIPEITAVGDYEAVLRVESNSGVRLSQPAAQFTLVRNTEPEVQITLPEANFATVEEEVTIQGRVSDPSIDQVLVGVDLPFTSLLHDSVTPEASNNLWEPQGLWYVSCLEWQQDRPFPKNASEPCSWRYGQQGQFPFAPGITTQGALTTREPILVGPETRFSFQTWYDTEPVPDRDKKVVQIAEVTTNEDGNDVVGEFRPIRQIVGRGFGGTNPPANAYSAFGYQEIEQAKIDFDPQTGLPIPEFTSVNIDMAPFQGKRVHVRFLFNSVNKFANEGFGWFVDDIEVAGAGFKGEYVSVTPLDPPVSEAGTTWVSQFATEFRLADGQNTIRAVGTLPYPPKPHGPNLAGEAQVTGFLDRSPPWVGLGGIDPITANPVQTLRGGVDDLNFAFMEVTQTNVSGTYTIYAINTLPGDRSFSVPVSLLEGQNVFEATAVDQSDLTSVTSFTVYLDSIGPSLTPLGTSYPVGAISARPGDMAILQVNATDELGVQRVFLINPNGEEEDMVPSGEIPEAVRDQWGVAGGWVLPIEIPSVAPPGNYQLRVVAVDNAGNATADGVFAKVAPSLEGFIFNLMPGQNLMSLPLIPDTTDIVELLGEEVLAAVDTIMYYDASLTDRSQEDRWLMFSPEAPTEVNTLHELRTGRGYWVKMKDEAFSYSAPLAPGLPATPRPILFSYTGVFLEEGKVPPIYPVVPGWNLVGFHSELVLPVTTALQSLESPQRVWASLYQYDNLIRFELEKEEAEIILGGFRRVLPTGDMAPGRGYWVFMVDSGSIVP